MGKVKNTHEIRGQNFRKDHNKDPSKQVDHIWELNAAAPKMADLSAATHANVVQALNSSANAQDLSAKTHRAKTVANAKHGRLAPAYAADAANACINMAVNCAGQGQPKAAQFFADRVVSCVDKVPTNKSGKKK